MNDPFDRLAHSYDETFTDTRLGRVLRRAVWRRLDALFSPGDQVLEINAGTGADAVHLASRGVRVHCTDGAAEMVAQARRRVERAGLSSAVTVDAMRIEDTMRTLAGRRFDGVLSNFGGLNCVDDLGEMGAQLAAVTRPGAHFVAVVMGPFVPWEWMWFGLRGDWTQARRRWGQGDGVEWRGVTVRYPSVTNFVREVGTWFSLRRSWALGAVLPPTFARGWAERHGRVLDWLNRVERRLERLPPLVRLADHYVVELTRRGRR